MSNKSEQIEWTQHEVKYNKTQIVDQVATISKRLREKAEDIERNLTRDPTTYDTTRLVEDTIHEILWMVPNLNLDGLSRYGMALRAAQEKLKIVEAI